VTVTDATPNALIYYTTDGTAPTSASTKYSGAITVSATETIEAIAVAPGFDPSAVASAKYKITWAEKVLYGLGGGAGVVFDAKGSLYSTTEHGGANNAGMVFEVSPSSGGAWTEKLVYSFGAGPTDGTNPFSSLTIDAKGNLYGTTFHGGANGCGAVSCGTVFKLMPSSGGSWTEKVLYSFGASSTDGALPVAGVILDGAGNIYGTTWRGGHSTNPQNGGTVFELSPGADDSWTEKLLYSFSAAGQDGGSPNGSLIFDAKGNLYGTTLAGGANGSGEVFELSPSGSGAWTEKVLYSFGATSVDGASPFANLIFDVKGDLYGTTNGGGANGDGTVFELTPASGSSWTEKVLYSFGASGTDGQSPYGGLVFDNHGNLYGSTNFGGANGFVDGTIFELSPAGSGKWTESILHNFAGYGGSTDGYGPSSVILDSAGNLYGTTAAGGPGDDGIVFEIENKTVATPVFSVAAGTYKPGKSLKITDATPGATIYYTTDGTTPSTASTKYTAALTLSATQTVKAIAVATGYINSPVASATYTIEAAAATPR